MNRLREKVGLSITAKWRLAATFALAGIPEVGKSLIKYSEIDQIRSYQFPGPTYGSILRDQAMALETLVLLGMEDDAHNLVLILIERMKNRYMSTQSAAYALYAISRFAGGSNPASNLEFGYKYDGQTKNINTQLRSYQIELDVNNPAVSSISIGNTSKGSLYVTKTIMGQPLAGDEVTDSKNLKMEVKYKSLDGKPIEVDSLKQGFDFMAEVRIFNPGILGPYNNMALSQIFPSGWEILNTRIGDLEPSKKQGYFTYRDIRDDRVHTFFNIHSANEVIYRVMLNAAYTGEFYLPAVSCEAMYNDNIYAREEGQWVKVVK